MFGYYLSGTWLYIVLVVPAFILALIAQAGVKSTYNKMGRIENTGGYSGAQAAAAVLRYYGITNVAVDAIDGKLSDHYDPRTNVIRLSKGVYYGKSIAAVGIACHEAGHAAQHAEGYVPIRIRNAIIPVCNIGSYAGIPLAFLGYFLSFEPLILVGLGLYSFIMIFQLGTLPVELNASKRAINV
ncbi:MAG: zinc metallopeptidase, partial [Clostridiales bacterium]|nr:zinc metallopeptidase [Clostridiales bacterium]